MPYYHCTKAEYASLIETGGFVTDYSWESFKRYANLYASLYGRRTRERISMIQQFFEDAERHGNAEEADRWRPELEAFRERWLKKWGKGTIIWVSDKEPLTMFGDACFEVRKPPGTKITMYGSLWWVPKSPIPPRYFKRIS